MTTWPGSTMVRPWRWLSRSTRVAAGTPIAKAHNAAAKVSQARGAGARSRPLAAPNHSKAAAADPQLPGPGRSNPAPKNVPTAQAHAVFLAHAVCPAHTGSFIAGAAG